MCCLFVFSFLTGRALFEIVAALALLPRGARVLRAGREARHAFARVLLAAAPRDLHRPVRVSSQSVARAREVEGPARDGLLVAFALRRCGDAAEKSRCNDKE